MFLLISGKTCLTYRFCSGKFPEKSEATIGKIFSLTIYNRQLFSLGVDFREKTLDIDGEVLKVCRQI